jgi:flagellar hook assembly protein FlgD
MNGPGGVVIPLDSGSHGPGMYRFTWDGKDQPEGAWTFRVVADDDLGRNSTADRQFSLNNTLGFVTARSSGKRVVAGFKLSRPARVAVRIETPGGALVRALPPRSFPAGDGSVSWTGRRGRYVVSVTATNAIGAVEQSAPVRLR